MIYLNPIPVQRHPRQPTGHHVVLVGLPPPQIRQRDAKKGGGGREHRGCVGGGGVAVSELAGPALLSFFALAFLLLLGP